MTDYKTIMNLEVEVCSDGITYISNDGSSGCEYHPTSREELKKAICDYIDNATELDRLFPKEEAPAASADESLTIRVPQNEMPEFVGQIIDVFEDFLEDRGVTIPSSEDEKREEDPDWEENSAILYGMDYGELQSGIEGILNGWSDEPYSYIFHVTDIVWDLDDEDAEDIDDLDLPTEVDIPSSVLLYRNEKSVSPEELSERLLEYLSDKYNFCIDGFATSWEVV